MSSRACVWLLSAGLPILAGVTATEPAEVSGSSAEPDFAGLLERYGSSVVPVRYTLRPVEAPPGGEGQKVEEVICGVIVSDDGLIAISGDPFPDPGGDPRTTLEPVDFAVIEAGEVEHHATALGLNRELNLAYLRFEDGIPDGYRPVRFEPVPIGVGDEILIVGLLPRRYDYARTFWTGRVNAIIEKPRRMYALTTFVQDLSIGGLAVTPDGQPLGLVAEDVLPPARRASEVPSNPLSILGSLSQGPRVGYPMIFPVSLFAEDLRSPPPFERAPARSWFGITMQPLSRPLGEYWEIDNPGGVIVTSVLDNSPAEGALIRPGDVILQVRDHTVIARDTPDLAIFRQMVEKLPRGDAVDLRVWRAGEEITLVIRPGIAPRTGFLALEHEDEDFGLTVRELTLDVIQAMNLPPDAEGVVIFELENAGWAMVSGLQRGDLIRRVNDLLVTDLDSFRLALDQQRRTQAAESYFFVQRGVETLFVTVRTDW